MEAVDDDGPIPWERPTPDFNLIRLTPLGGMDHDAVGVVVRATPNINNKEVSASGNRSGKVSLANATCAHGCPPVALRYASPTDRQSMFSMKAST